MTIRLSLICGKKDYKIHEKGGENKKEYKGLRMGRRAVKCLLDMTWLLHT